MEAQWIWLHEQQQDSYVEFYDQFPFDGQPVTLRISADSNYAVYLNGTLSSFGQYPDFPWYKVYDEIDLTPFLTPGVNHLAVIVWYYGKENMSYYPGRAGLWYQVAVEEQLLCVSGPTTLARPSRAYASGLAQIITEQLGYSFRYDCTREDEWMTGQVDGFCPAVPFDFPPPSVPRPVARCRVGSPCPAKLLHDSGGTRFLLDLGREEAGYLTLDVESEAPQLLSICYGEHIADGGVRRKIGTRDFCVQVAVRAGRSVYTNPFRRLGLRYLEVFSQAPLRIRQLSILPAEYPVARCPKPPLTPIQDAIYEVCVRTLKLCMHEHYEDTPWREQALYAMDSRNQMLCGYHAFREFDFARANLLLMAQDRRPDGFLSICAPSGVDLTIPSFTLHYFRALEEYTRYSGDITLAGAIWPTLERLIGLYTARMVGHCLPVFTEICHWNFYEWSPGMDGAPRKDRKAGFDAALNCLFSIALQAMDSLSLRLGRPARYEGLIQAINEEICARFFRNGCFYNDERLNSVSELTNALAVLCGAAGSAAAELARRLASDANGWTPVTLSMIGFKYDALLQVDKTHYRSFILEDIQRRYLPMLEQGATAFWETELGEQDFDRAGSLCHGWSALPVYYYHQLLR
ncbi:MAG: family 78 glycoside hydrolase catalytic domain [Christensenellales bacterium]|nr:family 78 glycoside hydrolase catalytic domain [Christensenellales bacterium]